MRRDVKYYQPDEETGGYRYVGKYYGFTIEGAELRRKKIIWLVLSVLFLLAFFGAGILDHGDTRLAYIALPYVACLPAGGYGLAGAYSLLRMADKMTIPQRKIGYRRLGRCAAASAVFSLCVLLGAAIRFALMDAFSPGFSGCAAVMAACSVSSLVSVRSCPAREIPQES